MHALSVTDILYIACCLPWSKFDKGRTEGGNGWLRDAKSENNSLLYWIICMKSQYIFSERLQIKSNTLKLSVPHAQ